MATPGRIATRGSRPRHGGAGSFRLRHARDYLAGLPFFVYVTLFLLAPDRDRRASARSRRTTARRRSRTSARSSASEDFREAFVRSIVLSVTDGDRRGGPRRPARVGGRRLPSPGSWLRRNVIAASGVLAQFGGVMLAFAFLATFGFNGIATMFMRESSALDLLGATGSTG